MKWNMLAVVMAAGIVAGCTNLAEGPRASTASRSDPLFLETTGAPEPSAAQVPASQPPSRAEPWVGMPAGHPDVSQMMEKSAHGLPHGHPDISAMTRPSADPVVGTLIVQAVQGTAGGPPVGDNSFVVEIYNNGQLDSQRDGKLDESGSAAIEEVPLGIPYQYVVRVKHGGIDFQTVTEPSSMPQTQQRVTVPVYETIDKKPDWNIRMRHMMLERIEGGVQVIEVIAAENPSDRAWIGVTNSAGKRETLVFSLPATAREVQLIDGFDTCCTIVEPGRIASTTALIPGVTQYQLAYVVPTQRGTAVIDASSPVAVKSMIVLAKEDGSAISADGLEGPDVIDMGVGPTLLFRRADVPAGTQVKVTVAGATAGAVDSSQLARVIAGAGGLLVFVLGGAFLFLRTPRRVAAPPASKG